ncbi:hypothetical protein HQQ80_15080 [Microbacteriaceae bacterium VKM Ac-2855]|nr:hypothetical protein [Microbacteriaceae bacterium VKM Ac-2855]
MKFFARADDNPLPKTDRGSGSLDDYDYELAPKKKRGDTILVIADSTPYQDELERLAGLGVSEAGAIIPRRTIEEERTDAPMPVRLFANQRPSGLVGYVPRGLENVVDAALSRLSEAGKQPRIPAEITKTKNGWRVRMLMHETRG